jgi:hypothetical protein
MAYLAVSYPKLSKEDLQWIQGYRKENDPRYFSVVDPHFTLVFGIADIDQETFITEVRKQVSGLKKFPFEIKVATLNQDDSGDYYHEFLVPDQGYSDIVKLHDELYSGVLSKYLRFDIDFIPHIGIGNSNGAMISKQRIDSLNLYGVGISGFIESVDVIEFKDGRVSTLERITLLA